MPDATPSFIDPARRDALARNKGRRFDDALTGAIDASPNVQRWQIEHIAEGLRQADAGRFASDEEIAAASARRR